VRALQLGALDYLPKRLLTPERLKTSVRLALRRVERRASRRMAKLAQSGEHPRTVEQERAEEFEATAAAPADLVPGYTIRSTIGESEKAVVYLALSDALGRDIALKVSSVESDEAGGYHLLAREYEAISNIRHPAVVELLDYGVHAGREYLAMEYFPRGDLKARMHQGITEREALRYVEYIASALRIVHHAGILHRDLKPPNVMVRENDDVALIDFGLARNLEGGLQSTRTGVLRGSPYYMSPEQALGEQLDARTDLYSLGIIFYEMLTGKKPFAGTSAIEVLQEHVNAPVPQLPERYAHYQPLLARLLAKSRDQRFASAEEVIEALATAREAQSLHSTAA
jgi:serine/threonine protein kinase